MGWDGMGGDGMAWHGMEWDGMGWHGMGWDVLFCSVKNTLARFVLVPSRVFPSLVVVALLPSPPFSPNAKENKTNCRLAIWDGMG